MRIDLHQRTLNTTGAKAKTSAAMIGAMAMLLGMGAAGAKDAAVAAGAGGAPGTAVVKLHV